MPNIYKTSPKLAHRSRHIIKAWIEAMRLRTLPASLSGVVAATGFALLAGCQAWPQTLLCLTFALLAQIASNFANEYYDFRAGLDRKGREGPRRGVTEGDITPRAMLYATYGVLAAACAVGCSLIWWGGWWLIGAGVVIAVGVLAYSTGPYPLSHHALGEVAVVMFFGVIPVNLTFYLQSGYFDVMVAAGSLSIGLMGANILIINNYRDMEDDAAVGKTTIVVRYGRQTAATLYLFAGFIAVALMVPDWLRLMDIGRWLWLAVPVLYLCGHTVLWVRMQRLRGHELNPLLGMTAMLMLFYALGFTLSCVGT